MKKIYVLIGLLCLWSLSLFSSEIKVASSVNSDTIGLQDILSYKIMVSGEDGNEVSTPDLPSIPGFSFRDVQSSTQSSFSWVNGKTTTSFTKTFTYSLIPKEKGQHTIPPVSFEFKGFTYKTKPIEVNVIDGSVNSSNTRTRRPRSIFDDFGNEPTQTQSQDGETFLVSSVNKKRVYKGEPVEVEYTLYTTENITGLSISDEKDYPGYGKDEVYSARELRLE
ncbi:MAG: BatD family protein, partial [Candidatus Cloacimonetes bacterium]|nr:BatD family protein [Candidatus Cloacimonadota bacterium]